MSLALGLGVTRLIFQKECKILPWQQIASINTQKFGISIHVALPLRASIAGVLNVLNAII